MLRRPDPTFYPSPRLAMEAPREDYAYTLLLSPDRSQPDALAVVDVQPGSSTYCQVVHLLKMPYAGDEFHHFGWNACSSSLSPMGGHAFLERRYLIIPSIRSSRIYVIDTQPHQELEVALSYPPSKRKLHKRGTASKDQLPMARARGLSLRKETRRHVVLRSKTCILPTHLVRTIRFSRISIWRFRKAKP